MKSIYDHFKIEAQVSGLGNWMTMLPLKITEQVQVRRRASVLNTSRWCHTEQGTRGGGQAQGDGGDSLWCLPNQNREGAVYISVLFLVRITKLLFTEKKKQKKNPKKHHHQSRLTDGFYTFPF